MKVIEVSVLVAVPDEVEVEAVREMIGESVVEGVSDATTLLDVSVLSVKKKRERWWLVDIMGERK